MNPVGSRIGRVDDLPKAVKDQLQVYKTDDLEMKILDVLKYYEGTANLDELIVGLYRNHRHEIHDRRALNSKVYRMVKSELLERVPRRKGVFKIKNFVA